MTFGFEFDPSPRLLDRKRPVCLANSQDEAGVFTAIGAIEVESFEIATQFKVIETWKLYQSAWKHAADAIANLDSSCEFRQVLTKRGVPGEDGAVVRFGWIALARDTNLARAMQTVQSCLFDFYSIQSSFFNYGTIKLVTDLTSLQDFLAHQAAPYCKIIRRCGVPPLLAVSNSGKKIYASSALVDPLFSEPQPWAPLIESIGEQPCAASFVIRFCVVPKVPEGVQSHTGLDVFAIRRDLENTLDSDIGSTALIADAKDITKRTSYRISMLRNRCLAVEGAITSSRPIDPGLCSIVMSIIDPKMEINERQAEVLIPNQRKFVFHNISSCLFLRPIDFIAFPGMIMSPQEAGTLVRLPEPPFDERSALPCSRSHPAPMRTGPSRGTCIGEAINRGEKKPVVLDVESRLRHVYVIGQTGTGKSTMLLNMIMQDIERGAGVAVLDPHGSLIQAIQERIPVGRTHDVLLIDPSDPTQSPPLNPLYIEADDPVAYRMIRDRIIEEFLETFDSLYDLRQTGGPMFERYFSCFMALLIGTRKNDDYVPMLPLMESLFRYTELTQMLADRFGSDDPIPRLTYQVIKPVRGEASVENISNYITSKLTKFYNTAAARRLLCRKECVNFEAIIRERKILLVHLFTGSIMPETANLLARQIILRLNISAMQRGTAEIPVSYYIYADEFHTFATQRFTTMLSEARKFGLGLVLAHQYTAQLLGAHSRNLLDAVIGNVGTTVVFRVGGKDAEYLEHLMAPQLNAADMVALPNYRAYVRSSGALGNIPFMMNTLALAPVLKSVRGLGSLALKRPANLVSASIAETELEESLFNLMKLKNDS